MRKLFVRSLAIAFVAFALLFGAEFFIEWSRAGFPRWGSPSWEGVNTGKIIDVLSPMARAYNNVLAMLIATIGLAIPLTANMHTPKLIEMFLRDKINRYVLTFMAFGAAHVLWVDYMIGPEFAPTWAVVLAIYLALAGWALLIPYFFYVVRFVDPSRLLVRLREDAIEIVQKVAQRKLDPLEAQMVLSMRVGQIGTIVIKSLDRNDRDVAAEGAWSIKVLLDQYDQYKSRMPKEWFVVDRADFVGLSDEALEMLTETKTWYEMKCLLQLEHGFLRALHNANDTVSTFSDALRVIACRAEAHHDEQALRLAIRFFNNYLREAIKAKNLRAVYDVFHQYRRLGRELVDRPELLREIGKHFSYYAGMARTYGMVFAPQLAIFDLGYVTRRAYERASPAAGELLQEVLSLPHRTNDDVHSMAVKAKLILGGFFVENKREAEAELVRRNLGDVSTSEIERAEAALLAAERSFFEVTDRQLNLEYVPPERREPLRKFCAQLTMARPSGPHPIVPIATS
ncbi:MAG: DUF2254 domain-containing protein [Myxococcales bacterium]|nr:DUF2254 domain-containing protein [Myxococcales bacterium]